MPAKAGTTGFWYFDIATITCRRLVAAAAGLDDEDIARPRQALDADAAPHRQFEMRGIRLEIVGHLVLGGEVAGGRRERHAVEPVEPRGREQAERVPALPPRVADAASGVEDDEGQAALLEVIAGRQAGLPAADDDDVVALRRSCPDPGRVFPTAAAGYRVTDGRALLEILPRPAGVAAGDFAVKSAGLVVVAVHDVLR